MRRWLAVAALAMFPAAARANGAFPDSLTILLPAGQPDKITLATNFGLIFTSDGGHTWEWTCEHDSSLGAILYQLAPPPRQVTFALGLDLVHSEDDGCSWKAATGRVSTGFLYDLFVDPGNASRVLAVADPNDETPKRVHVFESMDGGETFPASLFEAEPGVDLSGIEVPLTEPTTMYLAWASSKTGQLRSGLIRVQGGVSQTVDYTDVLGGNPLGIAAVDRQDPRKIFLRAFGTERDRLALSEDGGATVKVVLEVDRSLAGLVVRPDGTVFAAARSLDGGALHVSHDGGHTFSTMLPGPRFRALAERAGRLYAAGDDANDPFALGTSDDDGKSWKPLMMYPDVSRIKSCPGTSLPQACVGTCQRLAFLGVFHNSVCGGGPAPRDASPDAAAPPPPSKGCGCRLGGRPAGGGWWLLALLSLFRRRRPSPSPRSSSCTPAPWCRRSRRWR
jgi:MYXO-CTERM domain-containing protein